MDTLLDHLHPSLSGFPIAFLSLLMLLEARAWKSPPYAPPALSLPLLGLTLIVSIITYFSGLLASEGASRTFQVPDAAIEKHQLLALGFLIILMLTLLVATVRLARRTPNGLLSGIYAFGLVISTVTAAIAGFHGGELVFRHGAGVNTSNAALK